MNTASKLTLMVSVVLVLPDQRRRGFASQLLRTAIAYLQERGLTPLLDATPAGHEVVIHLTITDDYPMAQAFVILEARPLA